METKTETVLNGDTNHKTGNNRPRNTGGKRLPKYDFQLETTIPASDWEPYQAKHKTQHRKTNIDNPPNSRPDHTKTKT
jgi:hypothetical protein